MKTPQRSFTVEIKSSRRRSRTEPKSIWGDTDFKALAREAEAAHLFKSHSAPANVNQSAPKVLVAAPKSAVIETTVSASIEQSSSQASEQPIAIAADEVIDVPEALANETKRAEKAKRSYTRKNSIAPKPSPAANGGTARNDGREQQSDLSSDDIDALETENRLLKAELVKRLQLENDQLRQMLANLAEL